MQVINLTEDAEAFTCNAYLVLGERSVLVDAGAMDGVAAAVREHTDCLDAVVLTHQHGDHVAKLDEILFEFDCACYAYGEHELRTHHLDDGETVQIGDEAFEAIYSPGHATDHIALVSDSTIFSGDVVVHNDAAFDYGSFGRTDMPGQSRERLIESIKEILERLPEGVEHMYSGHGDEFHGDVRDVIETALSRAEQRKSKYPE